MSAMVTEPSTAGTRPSRPRLPPGRGARASVRPARARPSHPSRPSPTRAFPRAVALGAELPGDSERVPGPGAAGSSPRLPPAAARLRGVEGACGRVARRHRQRFLGLTRGHHVGLRPLAPSVRLLSRGVVAFG